MRLNRKTCLFPGLMLMGSSIFVLVYNHWLFVNLAMAFIIVFGFLVYFLAVHTHTYSHDAMLIFLGRAYICIALITLLHLLGLISTSNPLLIPTGGRLIEALALLTAPLFERYQARSWFMKMGTILLGAAVFLVSWSGWPFLPASPGCLFNAPGLIDYLVIIMLLMAIPHILNRARLKEHPAYYLLLSAVGLLVMSELSLIILGSEYITGLGTFYWLRLLAYYIMLFVLLTRGIREPYEQLNHAYQETLDAWGKA
ncbi:MAG: MASE3 domain-containing protein, partial [Methylocystaceae bacterium]